MGRISAATLFVLLGCPGWAGIPEGIRQAERAGNYSEALSVLAEYLESNPGDRQARMERLRVLIEAGRLAEADGPLGEELAAGEPDALLLNLQGRFLFKQGRYTEAIKSFIRAIEIAPDSSMAKANLGLARERAGDLKGARAAFEQALSLDPELPDALTGLAMLQSREGKLEEAVELLSRAERIDPTDPVMLLNSGLVRRLAGKYRESADYFCRAVGVRKTDPEMRNEYARALIYTGEFDAARIELEAALRIRPGFAAAIMNRGIVAEEQGRLKDATADYLVALERDPELAESAFRLGNIALESAVAADRSGDPGESKSRLEEAVGYFRHAIAARPSYIEARHNMILAFLELGRNKEAFDDARELAKFDPGKVRHQMLLGAIALKQNVPEEAIKAFQRATQLDASCLNCWLRYGNTALLAGNFPEAVKAYRAAVNLDDSNPQIWYWLGEALYRKGEMKAARKEMQKAIDLKPDYIEALDSAARISMRMKDMTAASSFVSKGIEIDPSHLGIFRTAEMVFAQSANIRLSGATKAMKIVTAYLRGLKMSSSDRGGALAAFQSILEIEPRCTAAHFKVGMLLVVVGDSAKGIEHLTEADKLSPRDSEVLYALATAYYDQAEKSGGKKAASYYEKACEIYRQAVAVSQQDPEAYRIFWGLGSALYKLKRYEEARRELEICLKINPFFPEAYNTLGSTIANQAEAADSAAEREVLLEEAVQFYLRALQANANSFTAHYNLGTMYHELKRYKEAIVAYENAIRLNPGFGLAYYRLARLYAERANWPFDRARAEKTFEKLLDVEPGNCSFLSDYGAFYFNTRRYQKAKEIWGKTISLCPDYHPARDGMQKLIELGY